MKIDKPIVFIDLETTGVKPDVDRIVEICICQVDVNLQPYKTTTRKINPEIPIPEGASKVHGIFDKDVADAPTFKQLSKGILSTLEGCDIAGFNSNLFDLPLLNNEFARAGIEWNYRAHNLIDVSNIYRIMNPRTLSAAVKHYLGREHTEAHSAEADVLATLDIFREQVSKHKLDMPATMEKLALFSNYEKPILDLSGKFTTNKEGEIVFNFGQHIGKPATSQSSYLVWMLGANFADDTKQLINQILKK